MDEKKPLGRTSRKKRNQKYMIYLVSGIMIFSGLYIINSTNTAPTAPRTDYSSRIRQYQVYPIGNRSVPVRIVNESTDLILMFKQAGTLSADTVESILSEDIRGVNSSTFEVSGAFNFFRFRTDNLTKARQGVKNLLRTNQYVLYSVYEGASSIGKATVVGNNINVGDYAKVFLFQRAGNGTYDLLGFSQGTVPFGNVVSANLTNLSGVLYSGVLTSPLDSGRLKAAIADASDLSVTQPKLIINAANYSVSGNVTVSYIGNVTVVEADDFNNVETELASVNISFSITEGLVSFVAPLSRNHSAVEDSLGKLNVANVSTRNVGVAVVPEEITDGSRIIPIPSSMRMPVLLVGNASVGEIFNASISVVNFGNFTIVSARQV